MGVLIGIDFGKKRTGLAHTDPDHIIASGLTTVATDRAIDFLQDYHKSTPVEKFVVGQPKQKDGNFFSNSISCSTRRTFYLKNGF